MKLRIKFLLFVLFSFFSSVNSEILLKDISIKGELRFREIYYQSESIAPSYLEGTGKKEVSYMDLFFRNRINFQILPTFLIGSVIDIYSVFGEGNGAISSPDLGIQARNVFAEIKMFKTGKLTGGFTSFTLPEGFILATNGAGLKYEQSFLDDLFLPYLFWLKAYDNSRDNLANGIGLSDYKDNDILISGTRINPVGNIIYLNIYYVYDHDQEEIIDPLKHLHWFGISSKLLLNHFNIDLTAIYNMGEYYMDNRFLPVSAILFYFSLNYEKIFDKSKIRFSTVIEGASGEPGKSYRKDQFMNINPSYGINNIALDNSAGISLNQGGEFSGLTNFSFVTDYNMEHLDLKLIFSHLRLFNQILTLASYYGNELDLNISFDMNNMINLSLQGGVFFPEIAFNTLSGNDLQNPIIEVVAFASLKY